MKNRILFCLMFCTVPYHLFAANGNKYSELFSSVTTITEIAKYLGVVILTLSLIAEGVITFFGNNMSDTVKHTLGRVATGGCFIGGAGALTGFILGSNSDISASFVKDSIIVALNIHPSLFVV